jgi:transcriptional regulator with PAS, ATPase and Fis domain
MQHKEGAYCLKTIERETIEKAIAKYKNKDEAAKALGIGRATLFRKLKEYKL